jgi:hypothetical protein
VWFVVVVGLALLVVAVSVALFAWRRMRLLRAGGVDVAMRVRKKDGGRGWHLGVAHYRGEEFTWYRALSLRSGPNRVLNRRNVEIATRREPSLAETYTMPTGSTVLTVTGLTVAGLESNVELAMGPDALTGFLSWLESAPPGKSVPWAS